MKLLLMRGEENPGAWTEFDFDEADLWPNLALCPILHREGRLTATPRAPIALLYGMGTVKVAYKGDEVEFFNGLKWMVI